MSDDLGPDVDEVGDEEVGGRQSAVGSSGDEPVTEPVDEPVGEPVVEAVEEAAQEPVHEPVDDDLKDLRRLTRRGFFTMGIAATAGFATWKWLRTRPREAGLQWPFRRVLEANESIARGYFSTSRLSPTFRRSNVTRARLNGRQGLKSPIDLDAWRLRIEGAAEPVLLTIDDIKALPQYEMITELRCIEGWSTIVQWKGARLADLMDRFPPTSDAEFVSLETPDRGYYVGLELESALHPQTLLAYEMNGAPLPLLHGAPLRLAIPVKYGIKNIKRIGTIRYTKVRPADFWAERGYDWYAGH